MSEPEKIDPDLVRGLARLANETDLSEIEVRQGDLRIRIVRSVHAAVASVLSVAAPAIAVQPTMPRSLDAKAKAAHPGAMLSPMVGTTHLRHGTEAKAFVDVGSEVKVGDRLIVIEAMRTFSEILADKAGRISAIFVGNAEPVEYGQPLLMIE